MSTNLIDVILGVSVETDDDYGNLDDLIDKLDGLSRLGKIDINTKRDVSEIADATTRSVDSTLKRGTQGIKGDIRLSREDTKTDILDTKSTLWNKIDQIWKNISLNIRALKGSTGRLTAAESLMKDPAGVLRSQGITELGGTTATNIAGLARVLGDVSPDEIEDKTLETVRLAGQYMKIMELNKRFGKASKMKKMIEGLGLQGAGGIQTSRMESLLTTLQPEISSHIALGGSMSDALKERAYETDKMKVMFEQTGFRLYHGTSQTMKTEQAKGAPRDWTPEDMAKLTQLQRESRDAGEFETGFGQAFGESLQDFANRENMLGIMPQLMAESLGIKDGLSPVKFDMSLILKESLLKGNLNRDVFKDAFMDVLGKGTGDVDEKFVDQLIDPMFKKAQAQAGKGQAQLIYEMKQKGGFPEVAAQQKTRTKLDFSMISPSGLTKKAAALGQDVIVAKASEQTLMKVMGEVTQSTMDSYIESRGGDISNFAETLDVQLRDFAQSTGGDLSSIKQVLFKLETTIRDLAKGD